MVNSPEIDTFEPLSPTEGPELFFGLVGPIGAGLVTVCEVLKENLRQYGYCTHTVTLSGLIPLVDAFQNLPSHPEDVRIESHMDAGTKLRETTGRGDILALMSVLEVRRYRQQKNNDPNQPVPYQAYIFRSLKHPEEVRSLRNIYGGLFFLISAYLPKKKREDHLSKLVSRSHGETDSEKYREKAVHLIKKDEEEEGKTLGQDVSDAFPLADMFLYTHKKQDIEQQLSRFVEIIFGHPFQTPYRDEAGMYFAQSAALRSADLSRQVGAAICDDEGDLLSIGCNEVPKAFGGYYWATDEHDDRDWRRGIDSNAEYKHDIINEIIQVLYNKNMLCKELQGNGLQELQKSIESGHHKDLFSGAQIRDIIEFGRPVHAEMAAITSASRKNISIDGAILYCTTFPCHLCARLIISSGIKKVVYIEPYPKSKTGELYSDSVCVDPDVFDDSRVNFIPFSGIAPSRYQELFRYKKRKNSNGTIVKWEYRKKNPLVRRLVITYIFLEQNIVAELPGYLARKGYRLQPGVS